jgi:hypothetical protein
MRRKFSIRAWRSAFVFARRQIFAPLRSGMDDENDSHKIRQNIEVLLARLLAAVERGL